MISISLRKRFKPKSNFILQLVNYKRIDPEYKNLKYGVGLFQGVMSDEIPQEAVKTIDGYDMVDYSMLDVEFKQI